MVDLRNGEGFAYRLEAGTMLGEYRLVRPLDLVVTDWQGAYAGTYVKIDDAAVGRKTIRGNPNLEGNIDGAQTEAKQAIELTLVGLYEGLVLKNQRPRGDEGVTKEGLKGLLQKAA